MERGWTYTAREIFARFAVTFDILNFCASWRNVMSIEKGQNK